MKRHLLFMMFLLFMNILFANTNTIELDDCTASSAPIFPTFSNIGTFDGIASYSLYVTCNNQITELSYISDNFINGVWSIANTGLPVTEIDYTLNNFYQTYYFTPDPVYGQDLRTIYLSVYRQNEPQFDDNFSTICTTTVVPILPTSSRNSIVGSWSPATISNTVAGNYVFTPNDPCGFLYTISVSFRPAQDCNCGAFLSLETPELNGTKIYENIIIKTSNNYSVSGSKTIKFVSPNSYIELLPNSSLESLTFFETFIGINLCFQDMRPANTNLNLLDNDELTKDNISLMVVPNPATNTICVLLNNGTFNKVIITSIDGKTMLGTDLTKSESFKVDVSTFENGLYIVTVIDKDGKVYNQKLIKN